MLLVGFDDFGRWCPAGVPVDEPERRARELDIAFV